MTINWVKTSVSCVKFVMEIIVIAIIMFAGASMYASGVSSDYNKLVDRFRDNVVTYYVPLFRGEEVVNEVPEHQEKGD